MGFSSLIRFTIDVTMISVFMASIKKSYKLELNTKVIEPSSLRNGVEYYLSIGDVLLEQAAMHAKNYPNYFVKSK
jgi:Mor family transcriptional regulator